MRSSPSPNLHACHYSFTTHLPLFVQCVLVSGTTGQPHLHLHLHLHVRNRTICPSYQPPFHYSFANIATVRHHACPVSSLSYKCSQGHLPSSLCLQDKTPHRLHAWVSFRAHAMPIFIPIFIPILINANAPRLIPSYPESPSRKEQKRIEEAEEVVGTVPVETVLSECGVPKFAMHCHTSRRRSKSKA